MKHLVYDVVVCGGGTAGIAAALSSARHGQKTLLVEKQFLLGGLATAGIVTIYLPLCDGMGHQVSFGIAEELLRLSIKYGVEGRFPDAWLTEGKENQRVQQRFEVQFNPQLFAIAAEELLLQEGVQIMYETSVIDATMEGKRISALTLQNKSERFFVQAKSFVDATGDADICFLSQVPTAEYQQKNVLSSWYYSTGKDGYQLHMLGLADRPNDEKTEEERQKDKRQRFLGLSGQERTDFMIQSHQLLLQDFLKRRQEDDTFFPVTMATMPQLRMTRRIVGQSTMSVMDDHCFSEDSVGLISNWNKRGPVYEVPFSCLFSAECVNLITAGRCISTEESMWDVTRVIPCCAVTGQAAGTAAALFDDFISADRSLLQEVLQKDGVKIHL